MSSFRCLRKSRINLAATAVLLTAASALPALAQQAPQLALPSAPAQAARPALPALPGQQVVEPVEKALPPGANISDADQRLRAMAAEAGRDLDELAGSALRDARENNDVAADSAHNMNKMDLDKKIEIAERTKKLWTILNGEESEKEGQIKELEARVSALTSEKEALTRRAEAAAQMAARNGPAVPDPDPVVSSVTGVSGNVKAEILVPYMGKFIVKTGDTLPNGQKIVSMSANGVTVSKDGTTKLLGFGTEVPSVRPGRGGSSQN